MGLTDMKIERLRKFLEEEKSIFQKTCKEDKRMNLPANSFFILGEGGYFDIMTKLVSSFFSIMISMFFILLSSENINSVPYCLIFGIAVYCLLSFNTQETLKSSVMNKFIKEYADERKIKIIANDLPKETVEDLKKMIDTYGIARLKYEEIYQILNTYEKERKKVEIFGGV